MNRSESIVNISKALVQAQAEMGNAVKGSANPFFKSKYADLNSIREACLPALNKYGITVLQPTTVLDGKLYVETLLLHESGEFISGVYEVIVGKQNDPQAFGAAMSYSRRYSLQSMVNLGAEDDDAESAMGRNKSLSKPTQAVAGKQESVESEKVVAPTPARKGFGVSGAILGGVKTETTKVEIAQTESDEEWS